MKLLKTITLVAILWFVTTGCITKVQVININNFGDTQDVSDVDFLQKGSDPRDSLNGNTLEALNGLPLP